MDDLPISILFRQITPSYAETIPMPYRFDTRLVIPGRSIDGFHSSRQQILEMLLQRDWWDESDLPLGFSAERVTKWNLAQFNYSH